MLLLALDLGGKRTGVASGSTEVGIASPVGVVEEPLVPGDALLAALARLIEEHAPDEVVVGLPLNMDGSEGPQAKAVRDFTARLEALVRRPVRLQDERLTSAAADWSIARSGLTHKQKKARRDALAAAAILRDYMDRLRNPPAEH